MVQGTSQNGAMRIAKNGFGVTATTDDGYYGRGIYFTSYLKYASCYAQKTENGKIFLLSVVIPGNPFPVSEHPFSVDENGKIVESMNTKGKFVKVPDPTGLYGQVSHFSDFIYLFIYLFIHSFQNLKNDKRTNNQTTKQTGLQGRLSIALHDCCCFKRLVTYQYFSCLSAERCILLWQPP